MRLDTFIIGFLLCAFMLLGGLLILKDQGSKYGVGVNETLIGDVEGLLNVVNSNASNIKDDTLAEEVTSNRAWDNIVNQAKAYQGITKIWQFIKLPMQLINKLAIVFFIDKIFINIIAVIILIAITFSIIYTYMRFQPR